MGVPQQLDGLQMFISCKIPSKWMMNLDGLQMVYRRFIDGYRWFIDGLQMVIDVYRCNYPYLMETSHLDFYQNDRDVTRRDVTGMFPAFWGIDPQGPLWPGEWKMIGPTFQLGES